jgi:hypothetical protein
LAIGAWAQSPWLKEQKSRLMRVVAKIFGILLVFWSI